MFKEKFKGVYIRLYKIIFKLYYVIVRRLKPFNNKKVVFVLSRDKELQGNLYFIYKEIQKQLPTAEIHFVYAENRMNLKLFKELRIISNAKYLILDDYYLPVYLINPDKKMKVIQLWHAAGAFKKFGHSTIGTRFGPKRSYLKIVPVHANYTHVYVSSEKVVPFYAEAFNTSIHNVYPLGTPRIDLFNNEEMKQEIQHELFQRYPQLNESQLVNVLIAPTYRATGHQEETAFNMLKTIFDNITSFKNDVQFIVQLHPYANKRDISDLNTHHNVIIAEYYSLNEWMLVSDAFITDYSSAIFDFSLLHKPFAHFVPDFFQYEQNRGLYQDIRELSDGEILSSTDSLVEWVNGRYKDEYYETSKMITYNFNYTQNVSQRIVKHFIDE
ncbi:MAG TPA: CDP-glycerol glycerophosphotransferase family protein [Virgibacillus sp.]|nr:CDP-glycerol glycerophosphotransferase family protein [Virgibacillus sp.]HLR68680.1 CDP-glycerol glycerophosphotransferase family protein [Virgibacillus sp.]